MSTRTLQLRRGDRPLPTTVYYPKAGAGRFPVVIFGHGLGGSPTGYADLLKRWASAGFAGGIVLAGNSLGVGQTFSGDAAPILFVHAAEDSVVPLWTGQAVFDGLSWPRAFLRLTGKEHSAPYLSRLNKQFPLVAAATVDFLRWVLYRDTGARARLAKVRGIDAQL